MPDTPSSIDHTRNDRVGVHDADSIGILRRADYTPPAPEAAPGPDAGDAAPVTQGGVFVPVHMLRPGATVEEAAELARSIGVTTKDTAPSYAPRSTAPTDEVMNHEYDGIKEYDNPTPGWWYLILNATIVFSVLYTLVYHSMVPPLSERHAAAEARALDVRFAELRKLPDGEEKLLAIMAQDAWLDQGASIFQQSCVLCHGQQGEGLVGPNLTDEYFKNATTLAGMYDVVLNGASNGAMPARGGAPLPDEEVALVTAYVASLRGQNLEGPRGPEGEKIPPFPQPQEASPEG